MVELARGMQQARELIQQLLEQRQEPHYATRILLESFNHDASMNEWLKKCQEQVLESVDASYSHVLDWLRVLVEEVGNEVRQEVKTWLFSLVELVPDEPLEIYLDAQLSGFFRRQWQIRSEDKMFLPKNCLANWDGLQKVYELSLLPECADAKYVANYAVPLGYSAFILRKAVTEFPMLFSNCDLQVCWPCGDCVELPALQD